MEVENIVDSGKNRFRAHQTSEAHNNQKYFAALKLIEKLFKDGHIPRYMFLNILEEYSEIVDTSRFSYCLSEVKEKENN